MLINKLIKGSVLTLSLLSLIASTAEAVETSPPNIVFILADDLGYGQLGATGHTIIKTPNLDELAAKGINFSQAYSGSTVCSPSRISLLTGRDSRLLYANSNAISIRNSDVTLAQVLQQGGYETALFGKYGVGSEVGVNDPLTMGFDYWYGFMHNIDAHRRYPEYLYRNNVKEKVEANAKGNKGAYSEEIFAQEAVSYIGKKHDKPFFVFLSFSTPHAELAVPKKYFEQYRGRFEETPYIGMADGKSDTVYEHFYPEQVAQPNATTAAMITAMDDYVGQVLTALKSAGLEENTLVIFTSDNGPHEEGGADPAYFEAAKPYRGTKRDLLDGGIHVPMIASWPAVIKAGRIDSTPIAFWDMLPTFAQLSGVGLDTMPGVLTNGISVLPLLKRQGVKEQGVKLPKRVMYWEFATRMWANTGTSPYQAARKGDWKAVRYGPQAPMELYNIIKDPGESTNLAAASPELTHYFEKLFEEQLKIGR